MGNKGNHLDTKQKVELGGSISDQILAGIHVYKIWYCKSLINLHLAL